MSSKHQYYSALDGVRAIAALMVLIFHAAQEGLPLPAVVNFGQTGVDLFFVLSGFLITSILLKARLRDWGEVRTFYARRSFRIFPLYYLCLAVCTLFFFRCDWPFWVYLQNIWASQGWQLAGPAHLWSLAVEEQFYLVWPFVVLFLPRRLLFPMLSASIAVSFGLRVYLASVHHDVYSFTLTRLDGLASGAILAVFQSRGALERWRRALLWLAIGGGALVFLSGSRLRETGNLWFTASKYTMLAALYTGVVGWVIVSPEAWPTRLLSMRPLRYIGRISYGLYVWHPFVLALTYQHLRTQSPWLKASVAFCLIYLTATASFYGFERPFLLLKERFTPERRATPRAPVAV